MPDKTPYRIISLTQEARESGMHSTKRIRNTRNEQAMKYFTPELYLQFNSLDVDEAECADEAWDKAEAAYKERLESIREYLPPQVVMLSELCLHDALVVARTEPTQTPGEFCLFDGSHSFPPKFGGAVAIVSVTIGEEVFTLIYCLNNHISTRDALKGWRFSKLQEQWLYDEVDVLDASKSSFVHRILLSTGVTLEIPFVSVIIHRFRVPVVATLAKQSA